jgi:hypothetical protein
VTPSVLAYLWQEFGANAFRCCLRCGAGAMAAQAASGGSSDRAARWPAVGGALFMLSDSLIAFNRFANR